MPRITTIPATKPLHSTTTTISGQQLRRVAGYARVSTDDTDQANSYEAQVDYYEHYIKFLNDSATTEIYTRDRGSGNTAKDSSRGPTCGTWAAFTLAWTGSGGCSSATRPRWRAASWQHR